MQMEMPFQAYGRLSDEPQEDLKMLSCWPWRSRKKVISQGMQDAALEAGRGKGQASSLEPADGVQPHGHFTSDQQH